MSTGIGTLFTASLGPGQTQTWFNWGWDPNYFLIWSVRPTISPAQVSLDRVQVSYTEVGITYFLTISNTGPWPANFEVKYYFKTIVQESQWRSLGPNNISGCVTQVALDPNNSNRVYALAQGGGLWKLESVADYPAATWIPLSDQHATLVGFAFAVAPSDSSIIYLAEGPSLLRSTDGGNSWASASNISLWDQGTNPWSHAVRRVVVDPNDANHVLIASNTGLWQAPDGATWTQLIAGDITDVAMDPGNSSIVYVAQRNVGVLKSQTGAAPWATILPWSAVQNPVDTMVKIALSASGAPASRTVAVKFDQQVFVSEDSGASWSPPSSFPSDPWGEQQFDWNNVLAIDPFDSDVILVGEEALFRGLRNSTDGTIAWTWVAGENLPTHEDQQSICFDPNQQGLVYLSNDGGVFRSLDGGQTWTTGSSRSWDDVFNNKFNLNYGLITSLFYRVGVSAGNVVTPEAVGPAHHAGLLACPFVKSTEWDGIQGHSWEGANTYTFPNQPTVFYLVQGADLWRQLYPETGTNDLMEILPGIGWPHAICMDNTPNSLTLFVGSSSGVLQFTTNPGANPPVWSTASSINLAEPIVSIAFAPSSPGMAYLISQSGRVFRNPNVSSPNSWVDQGSDWNAPQYGGVSQLAVDPNNSSTLYLVTGSQIGKSIDGGAHWNAIAGADVASLGTSSFQSILADPRRNQTLYVAGSPGVFVSANAAATWSPFDDGLPNAGVSWLEWFGAYLYASTWGRGLWRRQPFANYGDDNVNIVTQFTATLSPGETHSWFTWGWPQNWFVVWSVRPITDQGEVSLDTLDVELEPSGITYHLTITNTGSQPASFEAKYGFVSF